MNDKELTWEADFSKLYNVSLYRNDERELKQFIKSLLAEEREKGREQIVAYVQNHGRKLWVTETMLGYEIGADELREFAKNPSL